MAEILADSQSAPAAPNNGQVYLFPHSSSSQWASEDNTGRVLTMPGIKNQNTADVVANAADTYLAGSAIAIPTHKIQVGTAFRWRMAITKTAGGVATPIWNMRVGTAGTTADTGRLTFTGVAQTAVIDTAYVEVMAVVRSIGAGGIMAGVLVMQHNLAATGFANVGTQVLAVTSAGFDMTVPSLIVGLSVNPGAAGVWTHTIVAAEAFNL